MSDLVGSSENRFSQNEAHLQQKNGFPTKNSMNKLETKSYKAESAQFLREDDYKDRDEAS